MLENETRQLDLDTEQVLSQLVETDAVTQTSTKPSYPQQSSTSDIQFDDFGLADEVKQAVQLAGYKYPTPIQAEIIPAMLGGRDIFAQSQTGTGKTAAFALPILSRIKSKRRIPQVLVLTPTRELAIQVGRAFATYGAQVSGLSVATIYGGQDYEPQLKQLNRGAQVVVGTPGRVIDHIKRGTLDIGSIECLVLDEADEMLNMGFLDDVKYVLEQTPDNRQIALFSATLPEPIRRISERYLDNPVRATIQKKTMTAEAIRQRAVFVEPRAKSDVLIRFLEIEKTDGVIVFTRTRNATNVVAEKLVRAGLNAVALSGEMPQRSRERTVERFKSGRIDILVATDVAARGLDVTRVSHVFNFDLPEGSDSYVHRVGRTGRAGRKGEAIIFLTRSQRGKLRLIEKATRQSIEVVQPPSARQINEMRRLRFKKQITTTIAEQDLGTLKKMIGEYVEQSGQSPELIAAAVVHLGQQGRMLLIQDRPLGDDDQSENGKGRKDRGSKRARQTDRPQPGMKRYRIAAGKRDGVRPGNIVGAVANEGGIDGDNIGPICINSSYSTVDLPEDLSDNILELLSNIRVAGRPMKLQPARNDDSAGSRDAVGYGNRGGKPNRKRVSNDKTRSKRSGRSKVRGTGTSANGKSGSAAKNRKRRAHV